MAGLQYPEPGSPILRSYLLLSFYILGTLDRDYVGFQSSANGCYVHTPFPEITTINDWILSEWRRGMNQNVNLIRSSRVGSGRVWQVLVL